MTVTGYLALYTTLLGWQQYENLWNIAVGTGLIYLPFVSIILKSTMIPFTSMGAKDAGQIAVRRLTINIIMGLLIIAFAAAPAVRLDPKVLHYQPVCVQNSKDATPGNTGTTFDNMPVATGVRVPIFWYIVMAVSNGITHAAEVGLGCAPFDYRAMHNQLNTTKITDPKLKDEVGQFYADCYIPAYSDYMHNKMNDTQQAQVKQSLAQNGQDDIGWLGSQTFLKIGGFYDINHSNKEVTGFSYIPSRDFQDAQVGTPKWGKPDCKSWWSEPTNGLHKRLMDNLPPSLLQSLLHFGSTTPQLQDAAIRTIIARTAIIQQPSLQSKIRGYESLDDNAADMLSKIGGDVGIAYESLSFYPKLHLLLNALPIIQAAVLFALYAYLGLAMPFSGYRISFCITAAVVMFSVIFCSFIWHMTQWFDNYLMQALYGDINKIKSDAIFGILSMPGGNPNQMFVDMIIGTMYLLLPIFWLMVMSWAGIQAGGIIESVMAPASGIAHSAGQSARGLAVAAGKSIGMKKG